jgi:hypothetical protein
MPPSSAIRHVDADLDALLRVDAEVTPEGLVGTLEIVGDRAAHVDPAAALVAHEEVLALLAPVAALHSLLALEPGQEGPAAGVAAVPREKPPQGLDGLARPALALLDVGQKIEELGVVGKRAETLLEGRLASGELPRPPVRDRQARPVIPVLPRIEGPPIVLDGFTGPARLEGVPTEARVAVPRRPPRVVPSRPGRELAVPLARRCDLTLLVERVRLARGARGGVVARRSGRGLDDARAARLRRGIRDGGRTGSRGRRGDPRRLPPSHHHRATHREDEHGGEGHVQAREVRAPRRRGRGQGRAARRGRRDCG